ncbi:MAG TPA: EamA family transporter [Candidatus Angelobacter sp.]|nr:EamA family transporter [Candidatus Angelobacter sp.]
MTLRRYLILGGMVVFGAVGDVCLSRGMKGIGAVSVSSLYQLVPAVFNPWVSVGILFLLGFFISYATALSFADLTYVIPATSFGYVLIALMSQFLLDENVTVMRWIGILLVSGGVGVVAPGPSLTKRRRQQELMSTTFNTAPEGSNG